MGNVRIEEGWKNALTEEFNSPYFENLAKKVRQEYSDPTIKIYPAASQIFAAFDHTPYDKVKVVILGQDPYHGPGQANGLAFSVNPGVELPPSLRNIFKEVVNDTGNPELKDGDLTRWADQGVLLLNSSLTVREHSPRSHVGIGWELFTEAALRSLSKNREHLVFMLWGADAIKRGAFIDRNKHLVLESAHPSPLSAHRGFFGNHHFTKANDYLETHGKSPIKW